MAGDFIRNGEHTQRWSREQEAEIGVIPLWVKESLEPADTGRPKGGFFPRSFRGTWSS